MRIHRPLPDVTVLADRLEVPGIGHLPVNAFVLHAAEPVVVDTGLGLPDRNFLEDLGTVMDPADVRWIWLTHPDRDHTGGLARPAGRGAAGPGDHPVPRRRHPLDRVPAADGPGVPAQPRADDLGGGPRCCAPSGRRCSTARRPPDSRTSRPASSSAPTASALRCPRAELADCDDVRAVPPSDLQAGQLLWATVDSPWVHVVDPVRYRGTIDPLRAMAAPAVLSSHLPPALACTDRLLDTLLLAPQADPFVGPDQRALEEMLASFEPVAAG